MYAVVSLLVSSCCVVLHYVVLCCVAVPGAFTVYAVVSLLGVLFLLGCLPETQGLPLEEMEVLFTGPLCSGGGGGGVRYTRVTSSDRPPSSDKEQSDTD